MGMDAKVNIWVGLNLDDRDVGELEWEDIKKKLPDLFDDEESDYLNTNHVAGFPGVTFETFFVCDELCGFGIPIFYHDWDYGVVKFNHDHIKSQIDKALVDMRRLLDESGIDEEVHVWCQTDHS